MCTVEIYSSRRCAFGELESKALAKYAAAPMQVSAVVTPPAPAEQNLGVKKSGGGAETLPQQMIYYSVAVQQER
jgi:hypothetical protein